MSRDNAKIAPARRAALCWLVDWCLLSALAFGLLLIGRRTATLPIIRLDDLTIDGAGNRITEVQQSCFVCAL